MDKIIKFGATWCGPCRAMKPHFEEFQKLMEPQGIEIIDVDIDHEYELSEKYGVQSIPTTIFIKNGEVKEYLRGMQTSSQLASTFHKVYKD